MTTTDHPSEETLRKQVELEWQDHIHTRGQTWKALEIVAVLVIALIGLDWQVHNPWATTVFGAIVLLAACFGMAITLHHREVERRKFTHILNIEEKLGLHEPDLLPDVSVPRPIHWIDVLCWWKSNTPLFILRMHLAICVFVVVYVVARWVTIDLSELEAVRNAVSSIRSTTHAGTP